MREQHDITQRMKRQAYKPQPVKRVYIPKAGSNKKRPLGIPSYEDKLVQRAVSNILTAIYEQDFIESSFGFRPNRGCHDAIKLLEKILRQDKVKYIVDTDIKGFFDNVDHKWMMRFIKHRVADFNLQRLIARILKAGVVEEGNRYKSYRGTPQGGVISPILANIYLHYVIDIWFEKGIKNRCEGKAYMIRYADYVAYCFENKADAYKFCKAYKKRLNQFKLEVSEDKSKVVELRNADGAKGSFDFLGFTHYE